MAQDVKASFDLPSRFLGNVNESLAEQDPDATFVTAAHLLMVTGECEAKFKEWMVDELGERGLKRWEKAVGDCLDTARRMVHECFIPALERCQVVLSRLDGLSRFSDTATKLGLDAKKIRECRETVDVLNILGHDLLKEVCTEITEFAAFMRWMKFEAECQALEPDSERLEEMRESQDHGEIMTVLGYIKGAMQKSRLIKYLEAEEGQESLSNSKDGQFYNDFIKARASTTKDTKLPKIKSLLERMKSQAEEVFVQIAETLRKSIIVKDVMEMPDWCDKSAMDMRIVPAGGSEHFDVWIASRHKKLKDKVVLLSISTVPGSGAVQEVVTTPELADGKLGEIIDIGLIDDQSLMILATVDEGVSLFKYTSDAPEAGTEGDWSQGPTFEKGIMASLPVAGNKAGRLEINGRKDRRLVCIIDEKGKGYVLATIDDEDMTGEQDGESHMEEDEQYGV